MASTKQQLALARRVRMGIVGMLECCRCLYPLEHYETESMHAEECPAHQVVMSARAAGAPSGWLDVAFDIDAPPEVVAGVDVAVNRFCGRRECPGGALHAHDIDDVPRAYQDGAP